MKFNCDRQKLNKAVENIQRSASSKSSMAILEGILLRAENNTLTLCGYDNEIGVTTTIYAHMRSSHQKQTYSTDKRNCAR